MTIHTTQARPPVAAVVAAALLTLAAALPATPAGAAQAPQNFEQQATEAAFQALRDAGVRPLTARELAALPAPPPAAAPRDTTAKRAGDGQGLIAGYTCLPSCDPADGRFLAIAGINLVTLSDPLLDLIIVVPAGSAGFELGVFDGDGTELDTLGIAHWDVGSPADFEYTLYADPLADGSGTTVVELAPGQPMIPSSAMLDNDWSDFTVANHPAAEAPSGNYIYRLEIELLDVGFTTLNNFKVRALGALVLKPASQPFSYYASWTSINDISIIYPSFPSPAPTTYDGFFSFYFDVPQTQAEVAVWGGDFDRGKFDGTDQDTDDPDTPGSPFLPPWATPDANFEGVAVGIGGTTGNPQDDRNPAGFGVYVTRSPSVRWDLLVPDGRSFANDDPSGNQEWEQFRIATDPFDPSLMDYSTPDPLPVGTYEIRVEGVDMQNLNALLVPYTLLCIDEDGVPCEPLYPFLLGDYVWADADFDGVQDAGEVGIPGVVVYLVDPSGVIVASTTTDADGLYSFEVPAGTWTVVIGAENFASGGALDGATSTTGGDDQTDTVVDDNVLTYDFGYATAGSIGDLVWNDLDGDGVFEPGAGETGIDGVEVEITADFDNDGNIDFQATTTTSGGGLYLFDSLFAATYTVTVTAANFAPGGALAGMIATYDLDGGFDGSAVYALAPAEDFRGMDYGYVLRGPVRPVLECVSGDGAGGYVAYFGYLSSNPVPVALPIGAANKFTPAPADRGQPTVFQPGRTPFWPSAAFSVGFPGGNLVWSLDGRTATASPSSTPCSYHVFPDKLWIDINGNQLPGPPADLPADFTITAESSLGTATCTYPSGATELSCVYANQRPPALDDNGLWVPAGETYTVTESGLPEGFFGSTGLGEFPLPGDQCVPGRDGIEKHCTHTVENVASIEHCVEAADADPLWSIFPGGHALWLDKNGTDYVFGDHPGSFVELGDGTARLTGTVFSASDPSRGFEIDVSFSGFTTTTPPGSPKLELHSAAYVANGGPIDPATWWYYTGFSGTLTGVGSLAGALVDLTRTGPAFQVGVGANNKNLAFGASGWFTWTVVSQPDAGHLAPTGRGDFNVDLDDECVPGPGTGTLGYWKNHPEAWPVEEITIGGVTYSKSDAIKVMRTPGRGDKTYDLFKQLVAAKLNVLVDNPWACVGSTIWLADAWLVDHPVGSNVRSSSPAWRNEAGAYHQTLDDYNNGELCAPHRD